MMQAFQNMGNPSFVLLICWLVFLLAAVFTCFKKKAFTPYFLFAAAVCIAGAFALFTPYLFAWDEQFHALVGKNLSKNPLVPKLYPENPMNPGGQNWLNTVIWMHKQPLFTWQMALSIKLFGTSAFAVRLPSVLFHGVLVTAIFRAGSISLNPRTGFIAAILTMHSSFLLGLISGRIGTDHNDYIFLCYITLSFWAWFEWNHSANKKWLYWIGIFAGCAVLTKWLVGLLVFASWTCVILPRLKKGLAWKSFKPLLTALGISMLIALPWQIYTFVRFPAEAKWEMKYNSMHVFHAIEKHTGNVWYHVDQVRELYFNLPDFLILFAAGLFFLLFRKRGKEQAVFLVSTIGIVYLFFTFVKTKMPGFTVPAYSAVMLIMAFGITEITRLIRNKWIHATALLFVVVLTVNWTLKPGPSLDKFGLRKENSEAAGRRKMLKSLAFIQKEGKDPGKRIVFGVRFFEFAHISWMFYNDEIAYPFIPSGEKIKQLQQKGYSIAIIQSGEPIPEELRQADKVEILYFKK